MLHYRDDANKFEPSLFSIGLLTDSGKFIKGYCEQNFNNCMYSIDLKTKLDAGEYILVVDAIWNDSTSKDEGYRGIVVDIYSPARMNVTKITSIEGARALAKAFANHAQAEGEKRFYLEKNADYGKDVFKVQHKSAGYRLGYFYTRNDSKWPLKEKMTVNLKGCSVFWPKPGPVYDLNITPGSDHVVIFKQTETQASYGFSHQVHPREKSVEEIQELAKQAEEKPLGSSGLRARLYNKSDVACLFLANAGTEQINCGFKMKLTNLKLVDSATDDFEVTLAPGETAFKIFRPIVVGDKTSFGYAYSRVR